MAPPVESWSTAELEGRIHVNRDGKKRKGFDGKLGACELLGMLQYECLVDEPHTRDSLVRCWPVERLFRRCQDLKGFFMVETTAWEKRKS